MRNRIMAYGESAYGASAHDDSGEIQPIRLPRPPAAGVTPAGFVMLPTALLPVQSVEVWSWQQWVYQQAFERAQAAVTPSIVERDLAGYWN